MSKSNLQTAQNKLLDWYEIHGRKELPWRNTSDIYHVYVSEIMLQQTQVKRVMEEYYFQFLEKFPSFFALAQAPLEEVFGMWSGLGYYRRAKNLHESAKLCPYGLPQDFQSLQKLPGIGRYTASAICSFGYHQKVSVVDTNIARVLARFFGYEEASEKLLWQCADLFLNTDHPRLHNLALMDLGSLVCTPKNPSCTVSQSGEVPLGREACPLADACKGFDEPAKYYKTKSMQYEDKQLHYGVYVQNGKIAMKVSTEGMYKDMLELPSIEPQEDEEKYLGFFKHSVTKYRLEIHLYMLRERDEAFEWLCLKSLEHAPVSSMTKKALEIVLKNMHRF
ncbi:A/G-specific adenine glycosylase [bacterium]|nr:A/G-specific adenine glycosylase [bacterium]MBU1993272.1 A/G-specific adenine glycosylase [bacterium]